MSTVRIVTFNTLFGRWDGQMEFLRSLRPDILAVQISGRSLWCSGRSRRR
ncbi:hypothetical protein [Streptomyces flavidovirens]|nr:hypothetical protein [Streptomyces flavidovirens]